MDPYEATPEEQMAALAAAMRSKQQQPQAADFLQGWGNMGLQSGDRVLAPFGASQIQQAQQMDRGQGAMLMKLLGGRRGAEKSPEELDAMSARAEYERAKAANYGKARPSDPLREEALKLKIEKTKRDLARDPTMKGQSDDIYKWSGRIGPGIKDGLDSIGRMEAIAAEFGGIDKVPGVGLGEGMLPGQTLNPKADEFRRTGLAVISKYRNKMFGASLTPGEQAAFAEIANLGGSATAAQVTNAIALLKKGFTSDAQQSLAGAPEHAKGAIFKDIGIDLTKPPGAKGGSGLTSEQRKAEIEKLRAKMAEESK